MYATILLHSKRICLFEVGLSTKDLNKPKKTDALGTDNMTLANKTQFKGMYNFAEMNMLLKWRPSSLIVLAKLSQTSVKDLQYTRVTTIIVQAT